MKHSKEFSKASLAVCMSVSSLTGLGKVAVDVGQEAPATAHVVSNFNESRFANEYVAIGQKILFLQKNARKIGLKDLSTSGYGTRDSQVNFPEKNGFTLDINEGYGMPVGLKKIPRSDLPYSKVIKILSINITEDHGQKEVVNDNIQYVSKSADSYNYTPVAYDYWCSVSKGNNMVAKSGEFDQFMSIGSKLDDPNVEGAKNADYWFQRNVVEVDRLLSEVGNFEKRAMVEGSISKQDLLPPISVNTLCGTPK